MQNPSIPKHTKSSIHDIYVQYHKFMFKPYMSAIKMDSSRYKKSDVNQQKIRGSIFHNISSLSNTKLQVELANLSISSIQGRTTEMSSSVKESYFHDFINGKHNNSNQIINQNDEDSSQLNLKKKKPYQKDQFLSTQPILTNLNESLVDKKIETMKIDQKSISKDLISTKQIRSELITRNKLSQQIPPDQQSQSPKLNHAKQNINLSSITQKISNGLSESSKNPSQSNSNNCNIKSKLLKSNLFDDNSRASSASSNIKSTVTEIILLSDNNAQEDKPLLEQKSLSNQNKRKDSSCNSQEKEKSSSQSSQQDDYDQKINFIKHTQSQISQQPKQTSFIEKKLQLTSLVNNQNINVNANKSKVIENSIFSQKVSASSNDSKKQPDYSDESDNSSDYDSKTINQKMKPKVQQLNSLEINYAVIPTGLQLQLKKDQIKKSNHRQSSDQQQWTSSQQQEQSKLQKESPKINKQQNKQQLQNQQKTQISFVESGKVQNEKQKYQNQDQDSDQYENEDYENLLIKKTGSKIQNNEMQLEKLNKPSINNQIISKEYPQNNLSLKVREQLLPEIKTNQIDTNINIKHDYKKPTEKYSSSSSSSSQQRTISENQDYEKNIQQKSLLEVISQPLKPTIQQQQLLRKQQPTTVISPPPCQCRDTVQQNIRETKIENSINQQQNRRYQQCSQLKKSNSFIPTHSLETILTTTLTNTIIPQLTSSILLSLKQSLKQQISQQVKAHNELLYYQLKDTLLEEINQKFKSLQHFIVVELKGTKQKSAIVELKQQLKEKQQQQEVVINSATVQLKQQHNEEEEEVIIERQKEQQVQCQDRNQQFQTIIKTIEPQQSPIQVCQNQQQSSNIKQRFHQISNTHKQNLLLNESTTQQQRQHHIQNLKTKQQSIEIHTLKEQLQLILKTQIAKEIKSTIQNEVRQLFKEEIHHLIKSQFQEEIQSQLSNLVPRMDLKNNGEAQEAENQQQKHRIQNQFQDKQSISISPQQQKLLIASAQKIASYHPHCSHQQQNSQQQINSQRSYIYDQQPDRFKLENQQLQDRSHIIEKSQCQNNQYLQTLRKDSIESYEQEQQQSSYESDN